GPLAIDGNGNLYTISPYGYALRKITPEGVVSTLAGASGSGGYRDGPGTEARFDEVYGLAASQAGMIYLADSGTTVRLVTPLGVVSTYAGANGISGTANGFADQARFTYPLGIA